MISTWLALGWVYFAQQALEQKPPSLFQVLSVHLRLCMMLSRFFAHNFVQPVANGQRWRKTLKPILYDEASSLLYMNIIVYQVVWYQVIADEAGAWLSPPYSIHDGSDSGGKFHF